MQDKYYRNVIFNFVAILFILSAVINIQYSFWKIVLIPLLICNILDLLKLIFLKNGNYRLVTIFNKIYKIVLKIYAFSFLILWCYICISEESYVSLVILVPIIFLAIRNFGRNR